MKNKRILIASVLAVGAMAMAGSAFTANNSMPPDIVQGYGEQLITGVEAHSIAYNLNSTKDVVQTVTLELVGNTEELEIKWSFNDATPALCSDPGTFGVDYTTYVCDVNPDVDLNTVNRFRLYATTADHDAAG